MGKRRWCLWPTAGTLALLVLLVLPAIAPAVAHASPIERSAFGVRSVASFASLNWSGYLASSATPFVEVEGSWMTPCLQTDTDGATLATWIGIGGGHHAKTLIQAGTMWSNRDHQYHFFYQFAGHEATAHIDANKADVLPCEAGVQALVARNAQNQWCAVVWAVRNLQTYQYCYPQALQVDDATTAVWMDERPECNGSFSRLANFHLTHFSQAEAAMAAHDVRPLGSFSLERQQMESGNWLFHTTIAIPGDLVLGGTAFQDVWRGEGDGRPCPL